MDNVHNPILAAYLSDQSALVESIETYAHVANSGADRRSRSYSYSDRPDYNPGMNNPAEAVPPSLVSASRIPNVLALIIYSCLMCTWYQPTPTLWRVAFRWKPWWNISSRHPGSRETSPQLAGSFLIRRAMARLCWSGNRLS